MYDKGFAIISLSVLIFSITLIDIYYLLVLEFARDILCVIWDMASKKYI